MSKKITVQLQIPADTIFLEMIRNFIFSIPAVTKMNRREQYNVVMAVEEACENIISHAYTKKSENPNIKVQVEYDARKIAVTVIDKGRGFSRNKGLEKKLGNKTTDVKIGGLGLYIIENLMDNIDYSINPGVENKVRMIKYIKKNKK